MRPTLLSRFLAHFGYVKDDAGWYTVVLDWDGGCLDGVSVQVEAPNKMAALEAARREAWHMHAGVIEEIPKGADFDEAEAENLWYSVAILEGFAVKALV
ncbi:hypothetical protein [Streptomyces scabiei]|uniref:hypothetical protein n=1 Tax=Streptomyces scabiei TaxID=1930 RepID=UPI0029AF5C1A|nr:hypothetical protein [Streptomyces scabiei]MDX3206091.1 hypothetical protein [Streptomyces scabiei]